MILLGLLLFVEGLSTGLWLARIVPMLSGLGAIVIALAVLRGLTGAMQTVGGFSLVAGRRHTIWLCQLSLIASAILTTLEIGARITPNDLDPTWRWPLVAAYWVYAIGATAWLELSQVRENKNLEVRVEKGAEVPVDKNPEVPVDKNPEVRVDENTEVTCARRHDVAPSDPDGRGRDWDSNGREGPGSVD